MPDKIILDTETTGLLQPEATRIEKQPHIIEFYGCKINEDYEIIQEFETFLKVPVPISNIIIDITGITPDMLEDAPTFIEIYDDLKFFFLGCEEMVAHNLSFDKGMLRNELKRHDLDYNFPWPYKHTCTVEKSYPIKNRRMKLAELYFLATGKELLNAHRAKNDVLPIIDILRFLDGEGLL